MYIIKKAIFEVTRESNMFFDNFREFFLSNKIQIGTLFFILLYTYIFELTNYSLSIDEEWLVDHRVWIGDGRFGVAITKYLFGAIPVIATNNTFLAVSFLFLATIIFGYKIYSITKSKTAWLIFGSIFITFPFHADFMIFAMYSFEVSVGIFLALISSILLYNYLMEKGNIGYFLIGIITLIYSIASYQNFLAVYILCLSFLLFLGVSTSDKIFRSKDILRILSLFGISVLIACIIYFVIDYLLVMFMNITRRDHVENHNFWRNDSFSNAIFRIVNEVRAIISGQRYPNLPYIMTTFIMSAIVLALTVINTLLKKIKSNQWSCLFLCCLIISPFTMVILLSNVLPQRAFLELGLFVASVWTIFFLMIKIKPIKFLFIIAVIFLVSFQARLTTQILFTDYILRTTQDQMLVVQIHTRIGELGLGEFPDVPVVFVGNRPLIHTPTTIRSEIAGNPRFSFFVWGTNERIHNYFNHLGIHYTRPTFEQIEESRVLAFAMRMPVWPTPGSVDKVDGLIIVHLSVDYYSVGNDPTIIDDDTFRSEHTAFVSQILDDMAIKQTFRSNHDNLERISILFATFRRTNTHTITLQLFDDENNLLDEAKIAADSLLDGVYLPYRFERISNSRDRYFSLAISASGAAPGNAVTIGLTDNVYFNGALLVNGELQDHNLLILPGHRLP